MTHKTAAIVYGIVAGLSEAFVIVMMYVGTFSSHHTLFSIVAIIGALVASAALIVALRHYEDQIAEEYEDNS